ncbi:CDP-glycerol glycerophosphotransferase family protein [Peribacillus sp. SCS-26]|uniref:bifunctional glycosyltransferase/CDP-glycerol:glycerophosphate glycerophosphotransferase n=1 Tax=Paraperibacillus marinus TaxID=3115295 RepID=UPI003905E976
MQLQIITKPYLENIKVSAIIPVYNVEEYIEETLDSLLNQTLQGIEIILVDDGSSDSSPDIIMDYAAKHGNIVFMKQENSGPGAARNNGLDAARGEFVSFVDSDDTLPFDALETMYTAAIDEQADIVTGTSLSFNSKETWYILSHLHNGVYRPGAKNLVRNPELLYSLGPCNKLYKRSLIDTIRFPKGIHVTEDQPFVIEAYLRAKKMFTVDKIIYNYRARETDTNTSLSQMVNVDSVKVLTDIFKSLKLSDQLWADLVPNKSSGFFLRRSYYHRIISHDIWPALRSALAAKNEEQQQKSFSLVLEWLRSLPFRLINELPLLHRVLTIEVADRYTLLRPRGRKAHLKVIRYLFQVIDPGSIQMHESSKKGASFKAARKAARNNSSGPLSAHATRLRIKKAKLMVKTAAARRIVYPLAKLLPVKKKITFATNKFNKLGDSFKYIYEELAIERPDYEIKGYFKKKRSFTEFCRLYFDIATSRYVLLDDYYRPLYKLGVRKGTDVIQTWHAAGAFKKFGHSAVGYLESNTKEFENEAHSFYTKAVVTSQEIVPHYAEAFGLPEKDIYPLGLPRTDFFFDQDAVGHVRETYYGTYPKLIDKKVITYAPTFRGGPGKRSSFKIKLDLVQMAKELGDEYVLVLKLHPSVTKKLDIPEEARDFVMDMSANDISNVLSITDVLISDYSSLVFEYALLERPIIFYAYDLEDYLQDRGFYYDYESFVPGPIVTTTDGIIEAVREGHFDMEQIKAFKDKFFDHQDGNSAKRFVQTLIEK